MKIDVCVECPQLDRLTTPAQIAYKRDNLQKRFGDTIVASLSEIECQQHGQHPQVVIKGTTTQGAMFSINGCCKDLLDQCQLLIDTANKTIRASRK